MSLGGTLSLLMKPADVAGYLRTNGLCILTLVLWSAYFFLNGILIGRATLTPIILTLSILGLGVWVVTRNHPPDLNPSLKRWLAAALVALAFFVAYGLFAGQLDVFLDHRYDHFRAILLMPFLAILLAYVRPDAETVFKIFVVAGLFALYYSILLVVEQPVRGVGLLGKPIIRGNLGMFSALLSLVAIFALRDRRWKALAVVTFVSGLALSILSGSRGGWLAIFVGVFTLVWFARKPHPQVFRGALLMLLGFGLAILVFWDALPIESRIIEAINDIKRYHAGDPTTSLGYRLQMWNVVWQAFAEKPLFGQGLDSFNELWRQAIQGGIAKGDDSFMHPHNDYLLLLSQTGLVGFVIVMAWVLYPVRALVKVAGQVRHENEAERFLAIAGLIIIEALLEFMLTNNAFFTRPLFEVYIFGILLVFSALSWNRRAPAGDTAPGKAGS